MLRTLILFSVPALIWGSTWLMITFQLGVVDPLVSVFYRFFLAGSIMLIFVRIKGLNLKYKLKYHIVFALLGTLLFGVNYVLVYIAEQYIKSGLVAVIFTSIIFLNIFNGFIFLKSPIRKKVFLGAVFGVSGIVLVFYPEIANFQVGTKSAWALSIAFLSAFMASLGNITSAHIQKMRIPVIQSNAYAMLYGSLQMLILVFITGKTFTFDTSFVYVGSLLYLVIFGSIIAFGFYLTLLGEIGADKAAYITLIVPVIALILSALFESYNWSISALFGLVLITLGNVIILRKKRA